jgi:hypothetical protein
MTFKHKDITEAIIGATFEVKEAGMLINFGREKVEFKRMVM